MRRRGGGPNGVHAASAEAADGGVGNHQGRGFAGVLDHVESDYRCAEARALSRGAWRCRPRMTVDPPDGESPSGEADETSGCAVRCRLLTKAPAGEIVVVRRTRCCTIQPTKGAVSGGQRL